MVSFCIPTDFRFSGNSHCSWVRWHTCPSLAWPCACLHWLSSLLLSILPLSSFLSLPTFFPLTCLLLLCNTTHQTDCTYTSPGVMPLHQQFWCKCLLCFSLSLLTKNLAIYFDEFTPVQPDYPPAWIIITARLTQPRLFLTPLLWNIHGDFTTSLLNVALFIMRIHIHVVCVCVFIYAI